LSSAAPPRMLASMPGWLARLFPTRTLAGVRAPTPVRVDARIVSPNTLVSPITGNAGALVMWRFFAHYTDRTNRNNVDRYDLLGTYARGEDVVLSTPEGTVLVPARGREIRSAVGGHGLPLDVPPPPEAASVMQRNPGLVFYDELLLRSGDRVRLRATVAPSAPERGSAYRASGEARCDFEAVPGLGPVVVEDLPFAD
jgi:hypothetical protein